MHLAPSRFTDPVSPVFGASSAALFDALSLIDPSRLSPARRRVYRAGVAATTAWWAGVTTDRTALVPANVVAGAAAGSAVLALSDASENLDARIVGRLERAGVRHPRRWRDLAGPERSPAQEPVRPRRTARLRPAARPVAQGK